MRGAKPAKPEAEDFKDKDKGAHQAATNPQPEEILTQPTKKNAEPSETCIEHREICVVILAKNGGLIDQKK